ncbi:MAG: molybdopterin-synthase adenylyltransferase MoeB [Halobacteria archaeon]|nr:molybdopterin-synthase adenylyltransferase MoeB [Halobacteria archaeon]
MADGIANLNQEQIDRYSRHIILDQVGAEGQSKLLSSRVLVIGAGGLGSPVIQYLAAVGVGTIGIVDDDEVERSNLQRQVIHGDDDVGRPKVDSAEDFVARLNPDVEVEKYETRIDENNIDNIIESFDFVIDATDNFATRYLVNDACTLADKPFSHGAIFKFEGQVTSFTDPEGPCYRCMFPEAPPPGMMPNCAEAGVIGVLPGIIGVVQATEAVKYLLDIGDSLDGRMMFYDSTDMSFEEVEIHKDPNCPVCSESPEITSVKDEEVEYSHACSIN